MLDLPFRAVTSDFDEASVLRTAASTGLFSARPQSLVKKVALGKAAAVASRFPRHIIIGADTLVVCGRDVFGKPRTRAAAKKMLAAISGKRVCVITGLAVIDAAKKMQYVDAVEAHVWMKRMRRAEIDAYVKTDEPLDKAGAFAIQGRGAVLVKKIEGDYFAIVGLPLYTLAERLRACGVRLL